MLEAVFAGLFGLLIGSFLNVCIYRLPQDLSVVKPRSFCPHCRGQISWFDNIPVLTWVLLRGKCRRCGAGISWRYPVVELATGLTFFAAVSWFGSTPAALKLCVLGSLLIALFFTDLEERLLPDELTLGGVIAGLVLAALAPGAPGILSLFAGPDANPRWVSVGEAALGAAVTSFVLWSVGALYKLVRHREGLGFGDVKLMAMIGAFLGLEGALGTLLAGSVLGSVVGLAFILAARKDAASYELPFGSFLAIAGLLNGFYRAFGGGAAIR